MKQVSSRVHARDVGLRRARFLAPLGMTRTLTRITRIDADQKTQLPIRRSAILSRKAKDLGLRMPRFLASLGMTKPAPGTTPAPGTKPCSATNLLPGIPRSARNDNFLRQAGCYGCRRTTGRAGLRRATSLNPALSNIDFAPNHKLSSCERPALSTGYASSSFTLRFLANAIAPSSKARATPRRETRTAPRSR